MDDSQASPEDEQQNPIATSSYPDDDNQLLFLSTSALYEDDLGLLLTNDLLQRINNNNNENTSSSFQDVEQETIASMTPSILDQLDSSLLFSEEESSSSGNRMQTSTTTNESDNSHGSVPHHVTPSGNVAMESLINFSTDSLDKSLFNLKRGNYTLTFVTDDVTKKVVAMRNVLTQSVPGGTKRAGTNIPPAGIDSPNNNSKVSVSIQTSGSSNDEEQQPSSSRKPVSSNLPDLNFLCMRKESSRRPLSCPANTAAAGRSVPRSVPDWDSLKILLPQDFLEKLQQQQIANSNDKPEHLREVKTDEKEKDDTTVETVTNGVKLRQKKKRLSLGQFETKEKRKIKRFSLQEIQEVGELSKGIDETLKVWEEELTNPPVAIDDGGEEKVDKKKGKKGKNFDSPLTTGINATITTLTTKSRSNIIYSTTPHAKIILESLCPALYNLFSDGLSPWIETMFGKVPNSVWRVIEASVAMAPTTQILSELVLRINSESHLMGDDGPLKFNAFVCGLLNLGTLPSYLDLLRTKDRLLRTHYTPTGYLHSINTTNKHGFDQMMNNLKALNRFKYELDIFFETKLLHCKINNCNNVAMTTMMKRSWSDERVPKYAAGNKGRKERESKKVIPKSKTQGNIVEAKRGSDSSSGGGSVGVRKLKEEWEWRINSGSSSRSGGGGSQVTSPTGEYGRGSRIPRLLQKDVGSYGSGGGGTLGRQQRPATAVSGGNNPPVWRNK